MFMAIIYNKDKRSGKTYVYETTYQWDKVKKQSRSKRTLIGRLDEETGEIVPTDGRGKRRSPNYIPPEDNFHVPSTIKELKAEVIRLHEENIKLKERIKYLETKRK